MNDDVLVEERGGELEEGEGEGRALGESRLVAEAEDVGFDFGRDLGERRRGRRGGHAGLKGETREENGLVVE